MRKALTSLGSERVLHVLLCLALSGCTGVLEELRGPAEGLDRDRNGATPDGDADGAPQHTATGPGAAGLPDDVTDAQIKKGGEIYAELCAGCHGADGLGGPFDVPLTADVGFEKLVATIDATMPKGSPELCVGECAHDVAAYIQANFVVPDSVGPSEKPPIVCKGEEPAPRMLRLLTRREYRNTIVDLLGIAPPETDNVPVEPRVRGFDNNASASVVTSRHVDEYVNLAATLADTATRTRKAALLSCDPASSTCAKTFIAELGLRAFRRPLTTEEIDSYAALFAADLTGGSFDTGMGLLIQSLLISPNFLYRSEMGTQQSDGSFRLDAYETASLLSYTFIGSMPDAALLAAAKAGTLSTPAEIATQARRLLSDPRARDQAVEFVTQWLRTDSLLAVNKDAQIYASFSDAVRESMAEEQARFVEHVFFETKGTFADLFNADYVFVNATLAQFYGLPAPSSGFEKVSLPKGSVRGGILGLGAVHASHAHSNESSPIKRGLFVRDRLLCQDLPPPPANLDTTPPGLDPKLTTRARFAQHTADPSCAGCHQFIDGVGFGLEGFDGVGAQREVENGIPVDTTGSLLGLDSLKGTDKNTFEGSRGLSKLIAGSDGGQDCLPLQFYRFARGYAEGDEDTCSIRALREKFQTADLSLQELLVQSTQLDNFLLRN